MKIDLHIHSTASDGSFSPADILRKACELNLEAIALTDHDTVRGVREIRSMEIPPSLRFIPGIEISAASPDAFPCAGSFHILGYKMDVENIGLNRELEILREARESRNPRIIEKLNGLGFDIRLNEVIAYAGNSQMGRPHIACVMREKGYVASVDEAFDKYIGNGKPAYADKYRISHIRAMKIIRNAGGIPVMAHPGLLKPVRDFQLDDMVCHLKENGLGGIEVWYPEHSAEQTRHFEELADRYGLIKTGGTDFHGAVKPGMEMGSGRGDFRVPDSAVEELRNIGFI